MMAIANMSKGKSHAELGYKLGIVEPSGDRKKPFKPKEPLNFRAGRLKVDKDGNILNTGISTDFPEFPFTNDQELQDFFNSADISVL